MGERRRGSSGASAADDPETGGNLLPGGGAVPGRPPLPSRRAVRERRAGTPASAPPDLADGLPAGRPAARRAAPSRTRSRVVLTVLSLVLLAWAATCFVDAVGIPAADVAVVVAACASPYALVVAVPLLFAALRRRARTAAALAAVAGLLPWVFVVGYATSDPRGVLGDTPVRVMFVDADGGAAAPGDLVQAVRDHAVDLLVVTELSDRLAHDLTGSGLDAVLRPQWVQVPTGSALGTGVWSQVELTDATAVSGTSYPAVRGRVETAGGPLTLVAGHVAAPLDGVVPWRRDLRLLGGAARDQGPVLLLADLDATPWNVPFRRLAADGLQDASEVRGRGLRSTWPSWSPVPLLPLDHAMVGGGVRVTSVDTVVVGGTTHRALLATLLLPES